MGSPFNDTDEPLTPAGRLFLRPELNQIIQCVVGLKNPVDVDAITSEVRNSIMVQHPRFTSLMVRDSRGREHWRKTEIDLKQHLIVIDQPVSTKSNDELAVNDYMADLSTDASGLSTDKPLWEIHLLTAHKCMLFRIHHALGDGVSLMSLLLACCRKVDDPDALPMVVTGSSTKRRKRTWWDWRVLWGILTMVWFNFIYVVEFILRSLWLCDRKTAITGGAGVELWPRKLATARFSLEDMKVVKKTVANGTINDVLFGIISSGISRYLDHRAPNALQDGFRVTGVAMVNLREQRGLQDVSNLMRGNSGTRWGNKFGIVLLPVFYQRSGGSDPLAYLKRAKVMIERKKQSVEAHFSYKIGDFVMSYLGAKLAGMLNYRILSNTTFTISNVLGPQEEIMIGTNPVTFLRVTLSGLPHALTMHMLSYAGKADMQILVAKDIIPDPEFLAKCFEDALLEMKEMAVATTNIEEKKNVTNIQRDT
ncbi:O-acyltransferase WSD1-like [Quillaja saponaria]|uniref:O-acyltransferase WSD1-like n=1 Tax=Quillaja saponaria TaxID=32244 RepID=A0AAD7M090_QUISA|nr:O-acyltransferase WSD1-like [Quillaja saponaria]